VGSAASAAGVATLTLIGIGLGAPLAVVAWRALHGRAASGDGAPRMPVWGWWLVAFIATLGLGQAALSVGLVWPAAVLHVVAGVLPALCLISLTTRRGRELSRRQTIGGVAWGGLGGIGLAFMAEGVALVAAVAAWAAWISAMEPDRLAALQDMARTLQGAAGQIDPRAVWDTLGSPALAAAALGGVAVVGPVLEEAGKAMVIPFAVLLGLAPTPRRAFLLGVAAGAGFAMVEGTLYGVMALTAPETWAGLMLVRGGTAVVHSLATGLGALGWQQILVASPPRWLRGIGLGVLAVAVHGLWNLSAGAQALAALQLGADSPVMTALTATTFLCLGGLWVAALAALVVLPRRLEGDA
jgi:hypothetical protein